MNLTLSFQTNENRECTEPAPQNEGFSRVPWLRFPRKFLLSKTSAMAELDFLLCHPAFYFSSLGTHWRLKTEKRNGHSVSEPGRDGVPGVSSRTESFVSARNRSDSLLAVSFSLFFQMPFCGSVMGCRTRFDWRDAERTAKTNVGLSTPFASPTFTWRSCEEPRQPTTRI